ncbi:MAG TPA: DNA polymerase domain-containing protein [Methylomirabilota bacterium]|nr:DNA polymerase domain-containing protein [Methylomirabilota bacterium]
MCVWRRVNGALTTEAEPFTPFLLIAEPDLVRDAAGLVGVERLAGAGSLRWLARLRTWSDALAAREVCRERTGLAPNAPTAPYRFLPDPVHQYLLLSGRTFFGGLGFADLRRLALDIEVLTGDGFDFPSPFRPTDRVIAVALADTSGFRHVIRGDRMEERDLLEECGRMIRARDPDVIEGHNIFRFDLEYLEMRARRWGLTLAWGRDGSALAGRPARLQIAERALGYRRYQAAGRHIVDTWILAHLHDVATRDLPSFGLKDIARHLGVAAPDRTYVDPATISREFHQHPDRLMAYALDDAIETLGVSSLLAPPYFAQAQVVPFDLQSTTLRGPAAKIDALMLREYLHRRHAIPLPRPGALVSGALVALFQQGVARPVLHVDVTSLYPSLMLARNIAPAGDELGVFLELLGRLRTFRVAAKRLSREAPEHERAHLSALQQAFKLLINAFYGYLAFGGGHFNDYAAADRVTTEGRAVVSALIDGLGVLGATVLEADTDGVYFVPPATHCPADDDRLVDRITEGLPPGIQVELDGRFRAMLSYKLKTYALLDEQGRVSLRGSAFRSRVLEPFQRQLIEQVVRLLLTGRRMEVKAEVDRWMADFAARRVPARLFARTETLGETLEVYRQRLQAGARSPSAAYELAERSGRAWQPGDQVSYYVAGRGASVAVNECARLLSAWDPARPDENTEFYQAKLQEIWERFRAFIDHEGLRPPGPEEPEPSAQLTLF